VAERESGRSRDLGTKIGPQPPEEIRVGSHDKASWDGAGRCAAIIVNALDTSPDWRAHWLKDQSGKLAALGFSVVELDLRSFFGAPDKLETFLGHRLCLDQRRQFFRSSRAMKQSGFDLLIKASVARDEIVYAGFCAAAVIAFDCSKDSS
jgi:hypothetical protein